MHSSGMRTVHLLTVSQHGLWQGRRGTCPGGVPAEGGVPVQGVPAQVLPPLVDRQTRVQT